MSYRSYRYHCESKVADYCTLLRRRRLQEAIVKIHCAVERILPDALVFAVGADVVAVDSFSGDAVGGYSGGVSVLAIRRACGHVWDDGRARPHGLRDLLQRAEHVRAKRRRGRWRRRTSSSANCANVLHCDLGIVENFYQSLSYFFRRMTGQNAAVHIRLGSLRKSVVGVPAA